MLLRSPLSTHHARATALAFGSLSLRSPVSRTRTGACTTSSPDKGRANRGASRGLNGPGSFACTLFLGWKSSRKSAVKLRDKSLSEPPASGRLLGKAMDNRLFGGSSPSSPTMQSAICGVFLKTGKLPRNGGLVLVQPVSETVHSYWTGSFAGPVSALQNPVPGQGSARAVRYQLASGIPVRAERLPLTLSSAKPVQLARTRE